ncbi:MAG: hypothetical protein ABIW34_06855 [Ginsengibacter sp.]
MKAIRVIGFIIGLCALAYYGYQIIGKPNGKKYTVNDKHHIYYKGDGVTEDDAKKAGAYFTNIGMFGETDMDVQIGAEKNSGEIKVRFIVDKSKITPEVEKAFVDIGNDMANKIYPDKTLHLILADEHFDDLKDLGTAKASPIQSSPETKQTDDAK